MDFINEEYVLTVEVGYYCRQVSGTLNRRPGGNLNVTPDLSGDDIGQSGLTQPRWAVE